MSGANPESPAPSTLEMFEILPPAVASDADAASDACDEALPVPGECFDHALRVYECSGCFIYNRPSQ
jgi:hypothetical protein